MPGYAGSSWYFLRYMDPKNSKAFAGKEALEYWKDVDLYIGGTEHAVGHLMYARFWHKFLFDRQLVPTDEPFKRLINQGMIRGVIEYVVMLKEKQDGQSVFVSAKAAAELDEESLVRIAIPITYVEEYGDENSYLTLEGIKNLVAWRPEFADAIFRSETGTFADGVLSSGESDFRFYTQSEVGKMGKRYHNVVDPNDVVAQYGADCFRMYEMFLGPIEQSKPWDTRNIDGVGRFIRKFWSLFFDESDTLIVNAESPSRDELRILHQTIKRVRDDIERFSLNTCISHFMSLTNELKKMQCHKREILEAFVLLISPFAPFVSEEIWQQLGHETSVHLGSYPESDPKLAADDEVIYPICVNGKKRSEAAFDKNTSPADIEKAVLAMDSVLKWLEGQTIRKVIIVPDRMINIVV
jgi:leucyl-tRNA synthetase